MEDVYGMQAGWGGYSPGEGIWLTNYHLY